MNPAEVRRKNFIPTDAFPFNTISGITYDSGDYEPALDRALAMADYKGFEKRRAEAKTRGNYRGIGISTYVEICGLAPSKANSALGVGWGGYESARIRVHATGSVQVFTGTSPHGQGHETSWAQIAADALGVSPNDIEVRHGDTFESPGMGVGRSAAAALRWAASPFTRPRKRSARRSCKSARTFSKPRRLMSSSRTARS